MYETLTNRFIAWSKPHVIDCSLVAWQFIQELSASRVPHDRRSVSTPCRNFLPLWIPARTYQVLFQSYRCAIKCLDMPIKWRERSYIPCPDCRIMRIGEEQLRVGRDLKRCDGISMAEHGICNSLFSHVPDFDIIVYATRIQLIASL